MNPLINQPVIFQEELYKLISSSIVNMSVNEIELAYRNLNSDQPNINLIKSKSVLKQSTDVIENGELFGVDFPSWLGQLPANNSEAKRLMIVGIDPLRNPGTFKQYGANCIEDLIIGTPYAIHDERMIKGKTRVYWDFISQLAKHNFIYLTDIYKCYFYHTKEKMRSYLYFEKYGMNKEHIDLLKKEIELVEPSHIVAFGNKVNYLLNGLKKVSNNFDIIPLPHPAARAGSWKQKGGASINNKVDFMYKETQKILLSNLNRQV